MDTSRPQPAAPYQANPGCLRIAYAIPNPEVAAGMIIKTLEERREPDDRTPHFTPMGLEHVVGQ